MKYRIIKQYGLFYPQTKWLLWWQPTSDPASSYDTLEEAKTDIEEHKHLFSKIHKVDVVWRSW